VRKIAFTLQIEKHGQSQM